MTEFFNVLPPGAALAKLNAHLPSALPAETVATADALDRATSSPIDAPLDLPAFPRSTMDGYAVRAKDTFGASPTLPAYLRLVGEVPMGRAPDLHLDTATAALVHTGGMLPPNADAVVMVENTQPSRASEIEVLKAVAVGENVLKVGEDVQTGAEILPRGHRLRPQDIGGLLALGITTIEVAPRPVVGIIATGDEIVDPGQPVSPGQVRDINSYTVSGLVAHGGGVPRRYGIIPDDRSALESAAQTALAECDVVVLSAGSSVSVRDMTAEVIAGLGQPGVLVHGVAVRPGKPTILAVA
ncbi:MAG: molybdopterin-binding protein, partial [Anaerolineales bacterium]